MTRRPRKSTTTRQWRSLLDQQCQSQGHNSQAPTLPLQPASSAVIAKASTITKMLCTEGKYVMLLKVSKDSSSSDADRYFIFRGTSLNWIQLLGKRANGATILQALHETGGPSSAAEAFRWQVRACTTDAAGANLVAERLLAETRAPSWSFLHNFCVVHKIATYMTRTFSLVDEHISGLVNFSQRWRMHGRIPHSRLQGGSPAAIGDSEGLAPNGSVSLPGVHTPHLCLQRHQEGRERIPPSRTT